MNVFSILRKKGRFYYDSMFCQSMPYKYELGTECTWFINTEGLNEHSIIYSGGVGNDISFEKTIANNYKCNIFLFDPSETGLRTMQKLENQHELIHFFPVGLDQVDGIAKFSKPIDKEEGSFSIKRDNDNVDTVQFCCKSISSIMKEFGHDKVDLLKIDIEGFEYGVIKDLLQNKLNIQQICVEYHHFFKEIKKEETQKSIFNLKKNGYQIIHKRMLDYTFLRNAKQ